MPSRALIAIVLVASACSGGSAKPTAPAQEGTCRAASDCGADEICRGPDGCDTASTCQKLADLTCGGPQTTMCGCDGATFTGDQSCPGRPVLRQAACDAPASCVRTRTGVDCDEPGGPCPDGQAREYANGCWQACVPNRELRLRERCRLSEGRAAMRRRGFSLRAALARARAPAESSHRAPATEALSAATRAHAGAARACTMTASTAGRYPASSK